MILTESNPSKIQELVKKYKNQQLTIGFVPTMGALHEGHLSLVQASNTACDKTIVSIFVNPTQFGPNEDFQAYPRTLSKDQELLSKYKVDLLFTPSNEEIYPEGPEKGTIIYEPTLSKLYCGASRPNHFQGVCTVVLRLFNLIEPDKAFFGEKDYQQMTILKKMSADLFLKTQIIPCPIIREANGLAKSSRNIYLSTSQYHEASYISQALSQAKKAFQQGETFVPKLLKLIVDYIARNTSIKIDYCLIVDSNTLNEKTAAVREKDRILFAGYLGKTRLIDNLELTEQ